MADHLSVESRRAADARRVDAFIDAAFAFAVTLLVVSGGAPASIPELSQTLARAPAMLAAFALLLLFWMAHRAYARNFPYRDGLSNLLSVGLVFVVLVYVLPLRLLAESAQQAVTGRALDGAVRIQSWQELAYLYQVYAVGLVVLTLIVIALHWRGLSRAGEMGMQDRAVSVRAIVGSLWAVLAGAVSFAFAWAMPLTQSPWYPGLAYWIIPLGEIGTAVWFARARARRQRDAETAEAPAS